IKEAEYRVSLTPVGAETLVADGHCVLVETDAGAMAGLSDDDYRRAGAEILPDMASVYRRAEMLLKVKEILPAEFDLLEEKHIVFTYIHSATRPRETQVLLDKKVVGIAYEDVMSDDGQFPLLVPMSEIAGEVGMLMGIHYNMTTSGGLGVLPGGAPGVEPAKIAILGAGHVGIGAAKYALGLGAEVTILDVDLERMRQIRHTIFPAARTLYSNSANVKRILPQTDILVNAVKWKPGLTIVSREMLGLMRPKALIVDIDCEPGGAIETCRFTTHDDPVYEVDGVRHYCVPNLPSAVAQTASHSLSNAILPYVRQLANRGWLNALKENQELRRGLGFAKGYLTFKPTATAQNREYTTPERALELLSQ
ncbi:MAG: alanine dehydrogenase, partial [Planctomycetota bacterium]|nr:alanine dehydrogenase [Planctomycetota bacterium]